MISIIAAYDMNRVIGKDGGIPWDIPEDRKRFRELTLGKTVIMGRRTYESIGHPLDGRVNIVVTSSQTFAEEGVLKAKSFRQALELSEGDVFAIGGHGIYRDALRYADRLYITLIDARHDGDVFFPQFDTSLFNITEEEKHYGNPGYTFMTYERK